MVKGGALFAGDKEHNELCSNVLGQTPTQRTTLRSSYFSKLQKRGKEKMGFLHGPVITVTHVLSDLGGKQEEKEGNQSLGRDRKKAWERLECVVCISSFISKV